MAFNEKLSDRIREALQHEKQVEEKYMFGGVCYMVKGKMCVDVVKDEMTCRQAGKVCRIDPAMDEIVLEKEGCRPMDFTGKRMKYSSFLLQKSKPLMNIPCAQNAQNIYT